MDTYFEVAQEVSENLGWPDKFEENLNRILNGILWAEQQILGKSQGIKYLDRLTLRNSQAAYSLPDEFDSACKIVITDLSDNRYRSKEVEVGELMSFESTAGTTPTSFSDLAVRPDYLKDTVEDVAAHAMYDDYVLFAIQPDGKGFKIQIKPLLNGYLYIYYSVTAKLAVRKNLQNLSPVMPKRFWFGIVAGATYYLMRREMYSMQKKGQTQEVQATLTAMLKSMSTYKDELDSVISDFIETQQNRSEPPIAKPFDPPWDMPEDYY